MTAMGSSPTSQGDYRHAAVTLWGEAGAYVHEVYAELRPLYSSLPEALPIVIGLSPYGACVGQTQHGWQGAARIAITSYTFWPGEPDFLGRCRPGGRLFVRDTMAHEMLHVSLRLAGRESDHDSDGWYAEITRLSPAILGRDLGVKRGADRKSVRVPNPNHDPADPKSPKTLVRKVRTEATPHGDVARWPQAFRPADYDFGAPIPCPTY